MRSHRNAMHCPRSAVFLWMVEMCRDWTGCAVMCWNGPGTKMRMSVVEFW